MHPTSPSRLRRVRRVVPAPPAPAASLPAEIAHGVAFYQVGDDPPYTILVHGEDTVRADIRADDLPYCWTVRMQLPPRHPWIALQLDELHSDADAPLFVAQLRELADQLRRDGVDDIWMPVHVLYNRSRAVDDADRPDHRRRERSGPELRDHEFAATCVSHEPFDGVVLAHLLVVAATIARDAR